MFLCPGEMKSPGSGWPAADVNERQALKKTPVIEPLRIKICQDNSHSHSCQAPDMPSLQSAASFRKRRLKMMCRESSRPASADRI